MGELAGSVYIEAPVEAVFDYVDDWRNTTGYMRGLVRWEPVDPAQDSGVGAKFSAAMKAGPITLGGVSEIVEHERPQRMAVRSLEGPKVSGTWTFTPQGAGTLVELHNTFELPGGVAGRIVRKVVEATGENQLRASLADLKRRVESLG